MTDRSDSRARREISTICRFSQRGDLLFVGTSKGNINIWDVATKQVSRLLWPVEIPRGWEC